MVFAGDNDKKVNVSSGRSDQESNKANEAIKTSQIDLVQSATISSAASKNTFSELGEYERNIVNDRIESLGLFSEDKNIIDMNRENQKHNLYDNRDEIVQDMTRIKKHFERTGDIVSTAEQLALDQMDKDFKAAYTNGKEPLKVGNETKYTNSGIDDKEKSELKERMGITALNSIQALEKEFAKDGISQEEKKALDKLNKAYVTSLTNKDSNGKFDGINDSELKDLMNTIAKVKGEFKASDLSPSMAQVQPRTTPIVANTTSKSEGVSV